MDARVKPGHDKLRMPLVFPANESPARLGQDDNSRASIDTPDRRLQ